MLMQALAILFRDIVRNGGDSGNPPPTHGAAPDNTDTTENTVNYFNLIQSLVGFVLDALTGVCMFREHVMALRGLLILHAVHFAVTCTISWIVIAIFRLLIVLVVARVRILFLATLVGTNAEGVVCMPRSNVFRPANEKPDACWVRFTVCARRFTGCPMSYSCRTMLCS
jgi:hypothetical protein